VGAFHRSGVIIFLNVEDMVVRVNRTAENFSGTEGEGDRPAGIQKKFTFLGSGYFAFAVGAGEAKPAWCMRGLFFPSKRRLWEEFSGVLGSKAATGGRFAAWGLLGIFVAAFL
jgi:hypothetical protein